MTDLYAPNLRALRDRYPDLANRLENHRPATSHRLVETSSGLWDLSITKDGTEQLCYGVDDPLADARAYWRQKSLRNPAMIVFLGLDLGYRLFAHLANPNLNTQCYVLAEESIDVFYHLLHVVDLTPLCQDFRFHLVVGVPEKDLFLALRAIMDNSILFTLVKATHFEGGSASYKLATEYYKALMRAFRDAAADIFSFMGNSPIDTFVGIRYMLMNLETIAREPGINQLFGQFSGRPAVVVATGPSLDKNYALLREIQDRAIILTVDASLKFLLRKGIRPHFATSLERDVNTTPCFSDIEPEACAQTVQVAVPVVPPATYAVYPGPKALMYRPLAHFDWLEHEKGTLLTGHSSANMAFKIAEALGCNPIVLVGQNLAYGEDGSTHSSAPFWGKSLDCITPARQKTFRVRGNVQEWVLTNEPWNLFRTSYVRDVAAFPGTVINATEGGAYIEGTRVMTLREAIDHHIGGSFTPAQAIRALLQRPAAEEAETFLSRIRSTRIPETVDALEETIRSFRKAAEHARRTLARSTSVEHLAKVLQDTYSFWTNRMKPGTVFYTAAFQVVLPTVVQVMTDYYDIPNHYNHVEAIHRNRLILLSGYFDSMSLMLKKLKQLFLDPENTLPVGQPSIDLPYTPAPVSFGTEA